MSDYNNNQEDNQEQEQSEENNAQNGNNGQELERLMSLLLLMLKVAGLKLIAIFLIVCSIFLLAGAVVTGSYFLTATASQENKKNEEEAKKKNSNKSNNSSYEIGKISFNNKNEIVINNQKFWVPLIAPENKNIFYALATIRFAEANRPDSTYSPNDFLSCGNYQQMTDELIGLNGKSTTAKTVMGDSYNSILLSNSVDIKRWSFKGYSNIQDGEIEFSPIYRGGVFVGYARYVAGMTEICKQLTEVHLKTGLFDRIAITRLQEQGRIDYISNYDLNVNNLDNFVTYMCRSQGPVDCGSAWNGRAKEALRSAINNNLYESVKNK